MKLKIGYTVSDHNANEWARLAQDAYRTGRSSYGDHFSTAATTLRGNFVSYDVFDSLQQIYRQWLVFGWDEVESTGCKLAGESTVPSANGYILEVTTRSGVQHCLGASWPAAYFVLCGCDSDDPTDKPILYHAHSLGDAERFAQSGGTILDSHFKPMTADNQSASQL